MSSQGTRASAWLRFASSPADLAAWQAALAGLPRLIEHRPLAQAAGGWLAQAIRCDIAVPPGDRAALDGQAFWANGQDRPVLTGQALAAECRQVVPVAGLLARTGGAAPPDGIRRQGSDFAAGQELLTAGHRLQPADLILLAGAGLSRVAVWRPWRWALVVSGSEVQPEGAGQAKAGDAVKMPSCGAASDPELNPTLAPSPVLDALTPALTGFLRARGQVVAGVSHCGDQAQEFQTTIMASLACADLLLLTGGSGPGAHDLTRPVLQSLGATPLAPRLWQLAGRPVISLPGQPAMAWWLFSLVVWPRLVEQLGGVAFSDTGRGCWAGPELAVATGQTILPVGVDQTAAGTSVFPLPRMAGSLASLAKATACLVLPTAGWLRPGDQVRLSSLPGGLA